MIAITTVVVNSKTDSTTEPLQLFQYKDNYIILLNDGTYKIYDKNSVSAFHIIYPELFIPNYRSIQFEPELYTKSIPNYTNNLTYMLNFLQTSHSPNSPHFNPPSPILHIIYQNCIYRMTIYIKTVTIYTPDSHICDAMSL